MRDTPRTDVETYELDYKVLIPREGGEWVKADFARELEREVAALKACIDRKHEVLDATIRQLRKVEAERDEARREVCEWVCCGFDRAKDAAKMRGWDCFKGGGA